ncbi:MAG: transposase [Planctomycetota bacterium]
MRWAGGSRCPHCDSQDEPWAIARGLFHRRCC